MNSPGEYSEISDSGQEDALFRDQIQAAFAPSDRLSVQQQSHSESATGGVCAFGNDFERSDRPVKKQSQSEPANSETGACNDFKHSARLPVKRSQDLAASGAASASAIGIPKLPIGERIGILFIVVSAVATLIVLLLSYVESLHDSVLPPPPAALASGGDTLVAEKFPAIGSAMIENKSSAAAPLRSASVSEITTESQQPLRSILVPRHQSALDADITSELAVQAPTPPIPPVRDILPTATAVPQSAVPSDPAVRLETSRLIKRGQDFLNAGDFAAARVLFKRAADAGSAEAALALGSTYDPSVIKQLGAISVKPDIDRALKWYATAADRGSAEAADQFANLMGAR